MARSDNDDPKLSEVKAVLQRLQGFEAEPDEGTAQKPAGAETQSGGGVAVVTGAIILAMAAGLAGAAYLFVRDKTPAPEPPATADETMARTTGVPKSPPDSQEPGAGASAPPQTPPAVPEVKAALEGARALMSKGRVRAAREQLLALAGKGSPDAAWDLARSYDPNVLAALPADAPPDVKEATRWYRAWYAAAVRDGLVADSVSLERIIGSMRQ
jgi:hypothetical protein